MRSGIRSSGRAPSATHHQAPSQTGPEVVPANAALEASRLRQLHRPLYSELTSPDRIRTFMKHHVFAVGWRPGEQQDAQDCRHRAERPTARQRAVTGAGLGRAREERRVG